ncbi:MAG: glycosyl hydrolase [Eubacteriales bacterium]
MDKIIESIKNRAPEYGSIPFWSWNDKLEEGELRSQIRNMKKLNMGGFFMHARGGLETEYLSDDWFNCVNVCIDEAKKLGMEAWSYDENGWPSGFAGGKLLEDPANFAVCIRKEFVREFPAPDKDTIAVYIKNADGTFTIVDKDCGADEYLRLYKGYDSSYVDTLDGNITDKFIAATHEEYLRRIPKEDAGTNMPGFFTDEPQYYRWDNPYSNTLPEQFRKAYGYEIFPLLPAVFFDFEGAEKFRYDYYKLMHELFINNFIKKIYDWCDEHGMQITGHAVEESSLGGQMMCCGGVMPFYEYEHIPGIDYLGRGIADDIAPKQLGSVCEQLGRKKALSEMFACCGWDVTPTELKRIADVQYASGVNLMCSHLYPYSERGQRKRDYPNHYSFHNPWQSHLAQLHHYYNNLGAALSEGKEYAPILVIHPIHGAYMKYKKNTDSLREIEGKFFELSRLLGHNQVPYHYGDELIMKAHASVENGKIKVGRCEYEAVVIPFTYTLDSSTAELLKKFIAEGGKVWGFGHPECIDGEKCDMSWLKDTCTKEDIFSYRDAVITSDGEGVPELRKMVRITDEGKILYITNITDKKLNGVKVTLDSTYITDKGGVGELDVDNLEVKSVCGEISGDSITLTLNFEEGESHVIVPSSIPMQSTNTPLSEIPSIKLPEVMEIAEKPVNMITLDTAALSKNGVDFDEPLPVMGIKDNLLREKYNGDVWMRFTFDAGEDYISSAKNLRVVTEPMNIKEIRVNGTEVKPIDGEWWFDKSFAVTDILPYTKAGRNEIVIKLHHWQRDYVYYVLYGGVSESLRNCLVFDCEIECIYLTGDFCVKCDGEFKDGERRSVIFDGAFSLEKQRDDVKIYDIVRDGYPFYAGHFKVKFDCDYTAGKPTMLHLTGRYATCDVTVNGESAGCAMFSDYVELSGFLKEGRNEIVLDICNSNRNLMGPHHRHDPEPYGLGPNTFSFENEWHGRECRGYVERYAFVRYGLDS